MTARRGVFWPLLLIAVGGLLLLANVGVIPAIRVVDAVNLWPLLLVLIGLDIALARRSPVIALAVELAVIVAGLALVVAQPLYPPWLGSSAPVSGGRSSVSVPRASEQRLTFRLNGGAGTFEIHGGATDLVSVTSDRQDLVLRASGGRDMDVRVDQGDRGPRFGPSTGSHVDAAIASDVATALEMNAGAGEFVVDMRDVRLADARLNVGAASLRLVLPKPSGNVTIIVAAGASSVVIEVPDGVEASVTSTGALTSLRSENPRIAGSETPGYASATDRVTVRVTAGASSVLIR